MPSQGSESLHGSIFIEEAMQSALPASHDIIFNPPSSGSSGRSPLKPFRQLSTSPPKANITNLNVSFPPPRPSAFRTDSPSKKPTFSMYFAPKNPLRPMFNAFPACSAADKENRAPFLHNENIAEFPDPACGLQPTLKRSFPITGTPHQHSVKKARAEDLQSELPDPKSLPIVEDDGCKPQYSYASLIGMAILRSPERKLTLAHIYKWIANSFAHYRRATDGGWQNSIRHNLSLNKAFIKKDRPKEDPGKGHYWAIKPGWESQFINKEKGGRRPASSSGASQKSLSQQPSSEACTSGPQLPALSKPNAEAKTQTKEPSSDATVPASDAPSSSDEEAHILTLSEAARPQSSPLQEICSSPPLLPEIREDTPSPGLDLDLSSFSKPRARKRKHADMDDSGYFSSLDSSALRPHPEPKLPRLDLSRQKVKRGRAEEEIARMRSSSHDISPNRVRSFMKQATPSLVSSSPLRSLDTALMPPPLTPAAKLKFPLKPAPSVSPNTNLRMHRNKIRDLIGSPQKHAMGDNFYSPAFKIAEDNQPGSDQSLDAGFSIFNDIDDDMAQRPPMNSQQKHSIRRSDQACRSSNILADITGTSINRVSPPCLRLPDYESPLKQKSNRSPLRFGSTVEDFPQEDLYINFSDDEEPDDFGGFDILQGFSKIGSNKPSNAIQKTSRPALGARSHTRKF
ncbi:uncharacterized protein KY384_003752 [Bacidia gigantensis]|uniref:uncharacterized protein n=1 Tax=Bacidia gigantensis TaxID=2732470 RepID=UPI001D047940|nr:uncharacterized protein KY384_003752 [Bacidia gigantensis]KAG8532115.1 hypothetical protein KY384_003752 [Bacidia gigantensis]